MDDSYYGEVKPQGGRHAKHVAADASDALEVTESPAIDDALEAVEDAEAAVSDEVAEAAEATEAVEAAATAESVEAAAAAEAVEAAATAESAATAEAVIDKPQKATSTGKKKRGPWGIVFIIALIVFICSMIALALIAFSYCQGQQKYDAVARDAGLDVAEVEQKELATLKVDWDALMASNPETVAWVYIPNTVINYPVVQGPDNDKYLTIDFDGAEGWLADYGAIFLDFRNNPDFSDAASFIYGHHMNDGSMFAELANFDNQDRFDECRTVYLLTPKGNYRLRSFALLHVDGTEDLVQNVFADDDEFTGYVQDKINRSVVNVGRIPAAKDMGRIFAFATCDDYGSGRYVLYAYIEDETASGLTGTVGISQEDGEAVGFDDDLSTETDETGESSESSETAETEADGQESEQNANDGSEQSGEE